MRCSLAGLPVGVDDGEGFDFVEAGWVEVVEEFFEGVDVVGDFGEVGFLEVQPGGFAEGLYFFFGEIGHEVFLCVEYGGILLRGGGQVNTGDDITGGVGAVTESCC